MESWKIQQIRAAVLSDLREFIPAKYYSSVQSDDDISLLDFSLANKLELNHNKSPIFTPRQLSAIYLLRDLTLASHSDETSTNEEATGLLNRIYDSVKKYTAHIGDDEAKPILFDLETTNENETRPLLQQRFQEEEILRVIGELGFTASKLPLWKAGKSGVKAQVRSKLNFPVKVFDKAWERLRAEGSIKE